MDGAFSPNPDENKTNSPAKHSSRLIYAGGLFVFIIALIGISYFSYPQFFKRPPQSKPTNTASTELQNTPHGDTTQTPTAKIQSSVLLSKYGQLQFPEIATSTPAEASQIPDDLQTLMIGAQNITADKLSFAGQETGLKIKFQYQNSELKPVLEKIVQIIEAQGLKQNAAARSEKFAFSDFQNDKFAARLSLTQADNSISGEILAIYK